MRVQGRNQITLPKMVSSFLACSEQDVLGFRIVDRNIVEMYSSLAPSSETFKARVRAKNQITLPSKIALHINAAVGGFISYRSRDGLLVLSTLRILEPPISPQQRTTSQASNDLDSRLHKETRNLSKRDKKGGL